MTDTPAPISDSLPCCPNCHLRAERIKDLTYRLGEVTGELTVFEKLFREARDEVRMLRAKLVGVP